MVLVHDGIGLRRSHDVGAGQMIAKQAAEAGKRVIVLEAGNGANSSLAGYNDLLTNFYSAATKDNQSPFTLNANAAMPRSTQLRK
ncbi:hypothetical protein ACC792_37580, partial [Rhizobium ruizarguesonis]